MADDNFPSEFLLYLTYFLIYYLAYFKLFKQKSSVPFHCHKFQKHRPLSYIWSYFHFNLSYMFLIISSEIQIHFSLPFRYLFMHCRNFFFPQKRFIFMFIQHFGIVFERFPFYFPYHRITKPALSYMLFNAFLFFLSENQITSCVPLLSYILFNK